MGNPDEDYEVGYGKPPKENKFAPGKSGNPNGRPKGSRNLATIIRNDGRQPVRVNGPDGPRYITKREAVITQIGNKAAQGDLAAVRIFVSLHRDAEAAELDKQIIQTANERDAAGKQRFNERLRKMLEARRSSPNDQLPEEEEV